MAWPPDVVSNQLIAASQINAIRDSVKVWGGDVSGAGFKLTNVARVGAGTTSPVCPLDAHAAAGGQSLNLTDGTNSTLIVTHGSAPTANSIIFNAQGSSNIHFENNGIQTLSLLAGNGVAMQNLPTTNPGTHSKKLWCDTASGNVIKCDV